MPSRKRGLRSHRPACVRVEELRDLTGLSVAADDASALRDPSVTQGTSAPGRRTERRSTVLSGPMPQPGAFRGSSYGSVDCGISGSALSGVRGVRKSRDRGEELLGLPDEQAAGGQ